MANRSTVIGGALTRDQGVRILLFAAAGGAVLFFISLAAPRQYLATQQFVAEPSALVSVPSPSSTTGGADPSEVTKLPSIATQVQLLESLAVITEAAKRVAGAHGLPDPSFHPKSALYPPSLRSDLSVKSDPATGIITATLQMSDGRLAEEVETQMFSAFTEVSAKELRTLGDRTISILENRVEDGYAELRALESKLNDPGSVGISRLREAYEEATMASKGSHRAIDAAKAILAKTPSYRTVNQWGRQRYVRNPDYEAAVLRVSHAGMLASTADWYLHQTESNLAKGEREYRAPSGSDVLHRQKHDTETLCSGYRDQIRAIRSAQQSGASPYKLVAQPTASPKPILPGAFFNLLKGLALGAVFGAVSLLWWKLPRRGAVATVSMDEVAEAAEAESFDSAPSIPAPVTPVAAVVVAPTRSKSSPRPKAKSRPRPRQPRKPRPVAPAQPKPTAAAATAERPRRQPRSAPMVTPEDFTSIRLKDGFQPAPAKRSTESEEGPRHRARIDNSVIDS